VLFSFTKIFVIIVIHSYFSYLSLGSFDTHLQYCGIYTAAVHVWKPSKTKSKRAPDNRRL